MLFFVARPAQQADILYPLAPKPLIGQVMHVDYDAIVAMPVAADALVPVVLFCALFEITPVL